MRRDRLLPALAAALLLAGCPDDNDERGAGKAAPGRDRGAARRDADRPPAPPLKITDVSFAGPAGHRDDRNFARGEKVLCLFTVSNFTYDEGKARIHTDIEVTGPRDRVLLREKDLALVDGEAPSARPGTLRTAARLELSPAVPAGRLTVKLTVRDLLGRRTGTGTGEFTMLGQNRAPSRVPKLEGLRPAADDRVPPGAVVPVTFHATGFRARPVGGGRKLIHLAARTRLLDAGGTPRHTQQDTLVKRELTFAPDAYPVEHAVALPRELAPGTYRAVIEVRDEVAGKSATGELPIEVVPRTFGIANPHVHDASGRSRRTFLLGEQTYVRLSVHGLKPLAGKVSAAVDLAVAGPLGGVYIARKDAATVAGKPSRAVASAGRFPVQLPLVLPNLAPRGTYRLVLRARDRLANKTTTREHKIKIKGQAPPPIGSFRVDKLEVRYRPDLPLLKGDTFVSGRTYQLYLRVGGMKLEEPKKMSFRVKLKADLRIKDLRGRVVHRKKGLFRFERTMTYRPLRVVMPARWTAPALPGGLYDLEILALDEHDDRVSQFMRRVEIIGAVPVPR